MARPYASMRFVDPVQKFQQGQEASTRNTLGQMAINRQQGAMDRQEQVRGMMGRINPENRRQVMGEMVSIGPEGVDAATQVNELFGQMSAEDRALKLQKAQEISRLLAGVDGPESYQDVRQMAISEDPSLASKMPMDFNPPVIEAMINRTREVEDILGGNAGSNPIGKINPSLYTPESIAAFSRSGDYSSLEPRSDQSPFSKIDSTLYTPQSLSVFQESGDFADLIPRDQGPKPKGPGQTQVDKEFAKQYATWTAGGGFADTQKQLMQLQEAKNALQSGANLTGALVGRVPDWVRAALNPDSIETREAVEEVVQRNLREVLGAQFTNKEGERLINRAYNDNLSEEVNAKRVARLIEQMEKAAEQKADAMRYFGENGTLTGWEGNLPTMSDFTSIDFDQVSDDGWSIEEVR